MFVLAFMRQAAAEPTCVSPDQTMQAAELDPHRTVYVHMVERTAAVFTWIYDGEKLGPSGSRADEVVAVGASDEHRAVVISFFWHGCTIGNPVPIEFEVLSSHVYDAYRRSTVGAHDLPQ
jgi:hypothetical protein